jgi:outer membrane lipoprotein-sorting protein
MSKILNRYLIVAVPFVLVACGSSKFELNHTTVSYEQLFSEIKNGQNKIETFQGSARISVDSESFSGTFYADIFLNRNDSMLINVEGPFGLDAGAMFIGNSRFIFHNKIDNQFYSGSVSDFRERNFMQFPIKISEVTDIFTAKDNLPSMKIEQYTIDNNRFLIQGSNNLYGYRLWIDPHTGHISKIEYSKDSVTIFEKEYKDFFKINKLYFPKKIIIKRPLENQGMSIYYTKLKINDAIDRDRFTIRISDQAQQFNVTL